MKFQIVLIMKQFLILFLIIATFLSFGQAQSQSELLEKAYMQNSKELLDEFFFNWHKEIATITDKELLQLNDTIKECYNVFSAFYKPHRLDSITGAKNKYTIYDKVKYILVQTNIKISFVDKIHYTEEEEERFIIEYVQQRHSDSTQKKFLTKTNDKFPIMTYEFFSPYSSWIYEKQDTLKPYVISNFHSKIYCPEKIVVYLNNKYDTILNNFLMDEHSELGEEGLMNAASSIGKSEQRKEFLENLIEIYYGHWGGYWQLETYPLAYKITFDKNMEYA